MNSRSPLPTPPRLQLDSFELLLTKRQSRSFAVRRIHGDCVAASSSISCVAVRFPTDGMKDKMKDFGKTVQESKGTEVKCGEVRGSGPDRPRFKIGEYNRATASFEMNSREEARPRFDLTSDGGVQYFKSSFARSMVVNNSRGSKSLDYAFSSRNGCGASSKTNAETGDRRNGYDDRFWIPGKEMSDPNSFCIRYVTAEMGRVSLEDLVSTLISDKNWDLRRAQPAEIRDDESTSESLFSEQPSSLKKSEVIEEHLRNQPYLGDHSGSSSGSTCHRYPGGDRRLDDVLLRSPLTSSCRSSFHRSYSSASDVDSVMLQSQVTTLQWQLRQAEASRQMYRAVMEQVVSFLQKTHKDLDLLQSRLDEDAENVTRVSRSRSVHAVDTSPTRVPSTRSEGTLNFQKAKSFAQIGGDPDCPKHGAMFREASWRKTRKQQHDSEDVLPSKISEEAFRLLRTVKSLLGTREPDLASRLSCSPANVADVSSASSTVSATLDSDQSDFQSLRGGKEPAGAKKRTKGEVEASKGSPPQLSISSADDESGFSSLNSFQEIGLPVSNSTFLQRGAREEGKPKVQQGSYPEVGLPRVEEPGCKVHRRWSSTPADGHLPKLKPPSLCSNGDVIKVLWV